MRVQVLVAAMSQTDYSLIEKMNIQTDCIVSNQCDRNSVESFKKSGKDIVYLNFSERGVGLNRNNALMRASGDICLFADDDMVYMDGYEEMVNRMFEKYTDVDAIVFNLKEPVITRYVIDKPMKVGWFNYLRYGTTRIAIKLDSIRKNGIYFNQCFGGGTMHCHGEDNIFLTNCLKAGLKIYAVPIIIAELTEERASTWNNGYDDKYLNDQGALYRAISRKWWRLLCFQDAIRRSRRDYKMGWKCAYRKMIKGGTTK